MHERLLELALAVVEQGQHESCSVTVATVNGAHTNMCGGSDLVQEQVIGADLGDEPLGGVQNLAPVACGVRPLGRPLANDRQRAALRSVRPQQGRVC